ncbi:HU family DNA-binding protein [Mesoplasma melaleucae]|uniref:HU family DNA-binding protein n=1 Tax=Mesoplasma melaleucae TaxID=81459 RepID=UPI0009FDC6B6
MKIKQIVDAVFDIIEVYLKHENVEVKINDFAKFVIITNKESFKNNLITDEKKINSYI